MICVICGKPILHGDESPNGGMHIGCDPELDDANESSEEDD